MSDPTTKRTVAFVDGQNLFYAAKEAFGYTFPNYDVTKLAHAVCKAVVQDDANADAVYQATNTRIFRNGAFFMTDFPQMVEQWEQVRLNFTKSQQCWPLILEALSSSAKSPQSHAIRRFSLETF